MSKAYQKPTLLITGAHGMVGRNLQAHPAADDWQILAPPSSELNLRDRKAVLGYLLQHRPDAVVHAAGVVGGIQVNMSEPVKFLADNIEIGVNLIRACLDTGISTLFNLASSCMYPKALGSGLDESKILTGALEPTNEGYALAKIVAMRLCEYAVRENPDLKYKTIIPCNLYGLWDKFDPLQSHLLPAIIHKVHLAQINGDTEVEIWGDGTARREFMFAGDLADALMHALRAPDEIPDKLNIGMGKDHTINEYYDTVASVIGWSGKFVHDLSRPVGMKQKLLDVSRQKAWGWRPRTSLKDGIRATYDFYLREYTQ